MGLSSGKFHMKMLQNATSNRFRHLNDIFIDSKELKSRPLQSWTKRGGCMRVVSVWGWQCRSGAQEGSPSDYVF